MEKFIIIGYKYCPQWTNFKLIGDFYDIDYEIIEIHNGEGLKDMIQKLFNNYLKDFLLLEFKGAVIIHKNEFIYDNAGFLMEIFFLKKIKINKKLLSIVRKEQWIHNHMEEFYWLSVGNNIIDLFKKSVLTSEKNQVGNKILMDKFHMFNEWFHHNPWILGQDFSFCDFSLLNFIKGIVEKNNNILNNYYHFHQWYLRMIVKKDPLFFLKNS